MKSTLTLNVTIYHSENLPIPDAQGIADQISTTLTEALAADPQASAVAKVYSACITGKVAMTVQAVHNADQKPS